LSCREAIRTERCDERVHLTGQDLTRQQTPYQRAKRNAAVRHGLVIARNSRERAEAGMSVRRNRAHTEPRLHDLRVIEYLKYEPRPLQKLSAERILRSGKVVSEPFVSGVVVQQDVSRTVGANVDARCVHEVSQRLARDGDPHE
jgi:hypothetical protein